MSMLIENEPTLLKSPSVPCLLQDTLTFNSNSSQRQSTDSESIKTTAASFTSIEPTPPALDDKETLVIDIVNLEDQTLDIMPEKKNLQKKPSVLSNKSARAASIIKQKFTQPVAELIVPQASKSTSSTHSTASSTNRLSTANQHVDTFVSFLRTSATTTYKKVTTSTDLVRSKSKRAWNIPGKPNTDKHDDTLKKSPSFYPLDPTTFLSHPTKPKKHTKTKMSTLETCPTQSHDLLFVNVLYETMVNGGYLTPNVYVPMNLWYQPNVRIPAMDAKITACESLLSVLEQMEKKDDFDNKEAIENDLVLLEKTLFMTNKTMKRKLGGLSNGTSSKINRASSLKTSPSIKRVTKLYNFDDHHLSNTPPPPPPPPPAAKSLESIVEGAAAGLKNSPHTITAWSSKLTKSVEKINQRSNQNEAYIKSLIELFSRTHILETWQQKLEANHTDTIYQSMYLRINACIELFVTTICSFVLKDYELLLDKWLNQTTEWLLT